MATFSELIRKKEHVLMRLAPISVRQLEIAQDGDVTHLLQLLMQKQLLMHEFEEIEQELTPYRDLPPEKRRWKDEAERTATAEAITHCAVLLEEIIKNDTVCTEEVSAQKDEVEEQIRRARQGSKVHNGYAKQSSPDGFKRFDRQS